MAISGIAPQAGAGYVVFPSGLIGHPDLMDMDIHMLLLLDQIGWREGDKDGCVHSTNADLASRIRKSVSSVRESIARIEAVQPPLIRRSVTDRNTRIIRLVYDRFGSGGSPFGPILTIAGFEDAARATSPPGGDVATASGGMLPQQQGDVATATTPPIESIRDLVVGVVGGDAARATSPQKVNATEERHATHPKTPDELVAWVPSLTDDDKVREQLARKVRLWLPRLRKYPEFIDDPIDWIQDSLIRSSDKSDIASYAQWLLDAWVKAKGRPAPELRQPAMPDETDTVILPRAVPMSPANARRAALLAGFDRFKPSPTTEGRNGDGR